MSVYVQTTSGEKVFFDFNRTDMEQGQLILAEGHEDLCGCPVVSCGGKPLGEISALLQHAKNADDSSSPSYHLEISRSNLYGPRAERFLVPLEALAAIDDTAVHLNIQFDN